MRDRVDRLDRLDSKRKVLEGGGPSPPSATREFRRVYRTSRGVGGPS